MRSIIDYVRDSTITTENAGAEFETAFPLSHMQDPARLRFAQTLAGYGKVTLYVDLGASVPLGAVALIESNLTEDDKVTIRGLSAAHWNARWVWPEEVFPAVPLITGWGDAPWGVFPWGRNYPPDLELCSNSWMYVLSEQRMTRYIAVEIYRPSDEVIRIGVLLAGTLVDGPNINYGATMAPISASTIVESPAGVKFANERPTRQKISFSVRADDSSAFGEWQQLLQRVGEKRPFLLQAIHGKSSRIDAISTRYGYFERPKLEMDTFNNNKISADFVEAA